LPGSLVDVQGVSVFVHRRGAGPSLVLLHGWIMSHFYFRDIIPALAERYDVIALDLPGFGESDRPAPSRYPYGFDAFARTVLDALDRLAVARAGLLGHSMGGGVALAMAALAPERVSALVLECAASYPAPLPLVAQLALIPGLGDLLFKRIYTRAQFAYSLRHLAYGQQHPLTSEAIDYFWDRLNRPGGREAVLASLQALARFDPLVERLGPRRPPALVVWGERDALQPLSNGRRLARELPAPLRLVPCTGHTPHEERPEVFLQMVAPFLAHTLGTGAVAAPPAQSCRSAS